MDLEAKLKQAETVAEWTGTHEVASEVIRGLVAEVREQARDANKWMARAVWLRHEIEQREDVYDGSDGEPRPNDWMSLATEYSEKFE